MVQIILFHHGYIYLISRFEEAKKIRELEEWEKIIYQDMRKLRNTSKNKGYQIINTMMQIPVQSDYVEQYTAFSKMCSEVTHEMFGCLLRLPYFDLIKQTNLHNKTSKTL